MKNNKKFHCIDNKFSFKVKLFFKYIETNCYGKRCLYFKILFLCY